jgi:hypothetical protein
MSTSIYSNEILELANEVSTTLKPGVASDYADRLSWSVTCSLLLGFGSFLIAKVFIGEPILCWMPAEFTYFHEQYAHQFCYLNSTYFVKDDETLPPNQETREGMKIGYYQWAPWVLLLLGIIFRLPNVIWNLFNFNSGFDVKMVIENVDGLCCMTRDTDGFKRALVGLAAKLQTVLHLQYHTNNALKRGKITRSKFERARLLFSPNGGNFLPLLYFVVKALNLVIAVAALFILQMFLDRLSHFYGVTSMKHWLKGETWNTVGLFPRVTYCDIALRILGGQLQRHTLQCVLPINLLNEKFFSFLWWWMLPVIIVSAFSLFRWLYLSSHWSRQTFLHSYLTLQWNGAKADYIADDEEREFLNEFLGHDGLFLMRFVSWNAGPYITSEILQQLLTDYRLQKADAAQEDICTAVRHSNFESVTQM